MPLKPRGAKFAGRHLIVETSNIDLKAPLADVKSLSVGGCHTKRHGHGHGCSCWVVAVCTACDAPHLLTLGARPGTPANLSSRSVLKLI